MAWGHAPCRVPSQGTQHGAGSKQANAFSTGRHRPGWDRARQTLLPVVTTATQDMSPQGAGDGSAVTGAAAGSQPCRPALGAGSLILNTCCIIHGITVVPGA